jgi:hypothetical protein
MLAAGLPQLVGQTGRAKSYAERLFEFVPIDRLDATAARAALCVPAEQELVSFEDRAIAEILHQTLGYPYFLQEWGKHSWNVADASPVDGPDAPTGATNSPPDRLAKLCATAATTSPSTRPMRSSA